MLPAAVLSLIPIVLKFILTNDISKITAQQAFAQLALQEVPFAAFEHAWQYVLSHKEGKQPAAEFKLEATDNGSRSAAGAD